MRLSCFVILFVVLFSPSIFASEPGTVQVRLFRRAAEPEGKVKIEPWIVMGVIKSNDEVALPLNDWVKLTSSESRVYSANGCYLDGKVIEKNGSYRIKLDGCAGGELKMRATLKRGEHGVFKLKFTEDTFIAVKVSKPK